MYGLSADKGKASWLAWTGLDVWTEQFFGKDAGAGGYDDIFPGPLEAAYKAPAPLVDLPAPTVEERDPPASGVFHLRVLPPPGAWTVHLVALPYKTPVTYFVDERPMEAKDGWLLYWAPPAEGFDVTVKAPALDSLTLPRRGSHPRAAGHPRLHLHGPPGLDHSDLGVREQFHVGGEDVLLREEVDVGPHAP